MAARQLTPLDLAAPRPARVRWDSARLAQPLAAARRVQGEVMGMARMLDRNSDLHAQLEVLTAEGVATSAIGRTLRPQCATKLAGSADGAAQRESPLASPFVEGLADVLLDATQKLDKPLTEKMLAGWQAALFPTVRSGLTKIRVGSLRGTSPMRIVSGPIGRQQIQVIASTTDRR